MHNRYLQQPFSNMTLELEQTLQGRLDEANAEKEARLVSSQKKISDVMLPATGLFTLTMYVCFTDLLPSSRLYNSRRRSKS